MMFGAATRASAGESMQEGFWKVLSKANMMERGKHYPYTEDLTKI